MNRITKRQENSIPWVYLLMYLLSALVVTAAILLLLAMLLYKIKLSEQIITVFIIATYVISGFWGGFLAGKRMKQKRFIWGLVMGVAYFFVVFVLTIAVKGGFGEITDSFITTLILCAGGGMLGGMLS